MGVNTKGMDYLIDLNPFMHKVECYNLRHSIRVDSYRTILLMLSLAIHNDMSVLNPNEYYKRYRSDSYDELLVELADDFYLLYGLEHDIDYRHSDDKLISYKLNTDGELIFSIKEVISVVHEDLDDLLGDTYVT